MGASMYVRPADRIRLERLAELDTRSLVDELTAIINEACERRGLDPKSAEPVAALTTN